MRLANRGSCRRLAIRLMSCLPGSSAGWALPAKMICIGRSGSLTMRGEPIEVAQDQVGPLVGGEPAGEADGEDVGIEDVAGGLDRLRRSRRGGGTAG